MGKQVLNLTSYNFVGLASNETIKMRAACDRVRKYGVGSCGPPGFYGATVLVRPFTLNSLQS